MKNAVFSYDERVIDAVAGRCTDVDSGARNVDHILTNALLPEMSREMLARMAKGQQLKGIKVSVGEEGFVFGVH